MPFLPRTVKKSLQNAIIIVLVSFGILFLLPPVRAVLSWSVTLEEDGVNKPLADGIHLSGTAHGQVQLSDAGSTYITGYLVTVNDVEVDSQEGLNTISASFDFNTQDFSDGDFTLRVQAYMSNLQIIDVSALVQFQNAPPPTYTLNVTMKQDGIFVPVQNGTMLKGSIEMHIGALQSGTPILFDNATIRISNSTYNHSSFIYGESLFFSVEDFDDGQYDFVVNASLADGTYILFSATVVVQNRDPVLLVLAIASFATIAIIFTLQVRQSKRRGTVAFAVAATASKTIEKRPVTAPAAPAPSPSTRRAGPGWKVTVSLAALAIISGWNVVWLSLAPAADVDALFGIMNFYPVLLVGTGIAVGLSILALLLLRWPAGKTLGGIVYILMMLASVLALGVVLLHISQGSEGLGEDATILGTLVAIEGGMLSWLIENPSAAVLADRFARWRPAQTPRQVPGLLTAGSNR